MHGSRSAVGRCDVQGYGTFRSGCRTRVSRGFPRSAAGNPGWWRARMPAIGNCSASWTRLPRTLKAGRPDARGHCDRRHARRFRLAKTGLGDPGRSVRCHPGTTVHPLTSTLVAAPLLRVTVEPDGENGLARTSQVMVARAVTLRRDKLGKPFGRLIRTRWSKSNAALPSFSGSQVGCPHPGGRCHRFGRQGGDRNRVENVCGSKRPNPDSRSPS